MVDSDKAGSKTPSVYPFPFVIVTSDGRVVRTLAPSALGKYQAAVEEMLADLCLDQVPPLVGKITPYLVKKD